MNVGEAVAALSVLAVTATVVIPIGRAVARRIAGETGGADRRAVDALRDEVDELRGETHELRRELAEAQARAKGALPAGEP